MTLDPAIVIAAAVAIGGLLLLVYRGLASGAIHPRNLVPREDFDAVLGTNKDLVKANLQSSEASNRAADLIERALTKLNGGSL